MRQPPPAIIPVQKYLFYLLPLCLAVLFSSGCISNQQLFHQQPLLKPASSINPAPLRSKIEETTPTAKAGSTPVEKAETAKKPAADFPAEKDEKKPVASSPLPTPPPQAWKRMARQPQTAKDSDPIKVELAFDNADLYEVLDTALYELYHVDYMIDPSIKSKVTFHLSGSFTRNQFINIINNVLQLSNLAIVRGPGHLYKIVRRNLSAGDGNQPPGCGNVSNSAGDVTRMIKLRYLSAATALTSIRPFLSKGATLVQNTVTNTLIISDTPENITKAAGVLSLLDVPYFQDIIWKIFPVVEVDAQELASDLLKVVKSNGLYNRPGINQGSVEIIPIKTLNALLVISRWPEMINTIEGWFKAFDHVQNEGSNVFVYFVENGVATDLADILKQLFGGKVAENKNRTTIVKATSKEKKSGKNIRVTGELSGNVDIIPDEINNAIVFKAMPRDYRIIQNVLKQLDIVPRQVLINVMVAEISLTKKIEYGIEWFLKGNGLGNGYSVQGSLDNNVGRAYNNPLGTATGFTLGVYDGVDFLRGLIHALGTDSGINILSSPNILAVDNKEATIEVGEEIPTVTGQVTDATSGSTVTNTIQYRKTGIILKVTPHINSSGLVKIELSQEVSDKGEYDNALHTYIILNRKAETSLVVHDGQTIVLGGIMKNSRTAGNSGIPFLKDIPGLGLLFGGTSDETKKTELILLLTPHVIRDRQDVDLITREFHQRVQQVQESFEVEKQK